MYGKNLVYPSILSMKTTKVEKTTNVVTLVYSRRKKLVLKTFRLSWTFG